ncbi:COX15/CtaA family protein [Gordonia sinesedis]
MTPKSVTDAGTAATPSGVQRSTSSPTDHAGRFDRIPGFGRPSAVFVHRWAIALLVANVGIVVTGGAVRLTDSGLGCPTWPRCTPDSLVPHGALGIHGVIEFGNRMLTWVLVAIAIATWVAVWRRTARHPDGRRGNRWLATMIAFGIPFQGVVGGITVLTELNPWVVALHFLLSMAIVSAATVLVFRTAPRTPQAAPPGAAARVGRALSLLLYVLTWVTIYLGTVVTGSGPHAGDADAPRNGLMPGQTTQLHADAVFILVGVAVAVALATWLARLPQARTALVFAVLLAVQGAIGGIQYVTDLPVTLVLAHMLGSALLLVAVTWLVQSFGWTRARTVAVP